MEQILQASSENLVKQTSLLESLANGNPDKTKTAGTSHSAVRLHGSGGLFAIPGLERDIISAHVRPEGLASTLPMIPSVYEDPRFGSITGFTATIGSQPANSCDDAPYGYMKGCNLTARFGRVRYDTNTIDVDKVMLKLHRGDFTDLMLRGKLLGLTGLEPSGLNQDAILNVTTMAQKDRTSHPDGMQEP